MENGLRLLGVPVRDVAGGAVELPPGQATHLAAVLALRGGWVARDELVALFWPDADPQRGRHNLAQLLYAVRKAPWGAGIEAEAQRVRWTVATDVSSVRSAAAEGAWHPVVALYLGDLLAGVPEPTAPALTEWLHNEREDLRATWRMALLRRAEELALDHAWHECALLLRRLLATDGLQEDAVAGLMRAEALGGSREAALQVYDVFRARLLDELGLAPLDTTSELAAAVRSGSLVAAVPAAHMPIPHMPAARSGSQPHGDHEGPDVRAGPVRGLGADATPFVGRALELAELHGLLRRETHRLVTLHGPGGTGKTRIARQLARERSGHHEGGAAWVPLAGATNESDAVESIAGVLGIRLGSGTPQPATALVAALAERDLLIVLDQVEHLPDLAGLVSAILDASPGVWLVATARAPLDVPGEAVVGLRGMSVPASDEAADAEAYDAVGLLLRAGRRSRPDLQPRGVERTALVALARLVGGSPLALELAAGWLRFLEPSELLEEVRKDLDVLRSRTADADPAHASLGAVFESSWSLLEEAERESLRRLAVFRGGCTRESAVAVTDVPLATLLALTNRSLLYRDGNTRFAMHSVVQHFAQAKLGARPALLSDLETRHGDYFLALARDIDRRLETPEQPDALARLATEGPNVAAAFERAIDGRRFEQAYELVAALGRFWRWRGRPQEGLAWTARLRGVAGQGEPSVVAVRVRLGEGILLENTGRYDEAEAAFAAALADAESLGDAALVAAARRNQSLVAWRRGELDLARELLEEVCDSYASLGLETDLAGALGNLGNVNRDAGDLAAAHDSFDAALEIVERIGHVWEIATTRNNKAIAHAYAGEREAAVREFERALELQRSIGNRSGMSMALTNLGVEHMESGELERAEELYREALALCQETGDADGVAHLNVNLGILAQWGGEFDSAHAHYADALTGRRDCGARGLVTQSVLTFLDLAVARGAFERALVLGGVIAQRLASSGMPLPAPHQTSYDACLTQARTYVSAARATELARRGAGLAAADGIEFALGTRALP